MSLILLGTSLVAIDTCDVAIISPRMVGVDLQSRIVLAGNTSVLSELTPQDVADAINADVDPAFIVIGPLPTLELGDVFVAGRHVQRVAPSPDGLGAVVTFATLSALLTTVAPYDVPTMIGGFNACVGCEGGGGGAFGYYDAAPFALNITLEGGGNTWSQNGPTNYTRFGLPGSSEPQPGDIVRCVTRIYGTVGAGSSLLCRIQSPFPIPNAGFQCVSHVNVTSGDTLDAGMPNGIIINRDSSTEFQMQVASVFTLETTMSIDLAWSHEVDFV